MVQCFSPDCNHCSDRETCTFYRFPPKINRATEHKRWLRLLRREDRLPGDNARVCSCHFKDGEKKNGPTIFKRNVDKLFDEQPCPTYKPVKKKIKPSATVTSSQDVSFLCLSPPPAPPKPKTQSEINETVLEVELDMARSEIAKQNETAQYQRLHYTSHNLNDDIIRMETGIPNKQLFDIFVKYVKKFQDSISYFAGWRVDSIPFEDQIVIVLMKLRQNYTNLHLAQLFHCSHTTISNIVITFIHVLHELYFKDIMTTMPSRDKNQLCSPSSFCQYTSCKVIIDCTDIEVATPGLMSLQNQTYSSYRGMNSFKVIVGVAPNAVITYISPLYPGSISDKEITRRSGFLDQLETGDLILADKGFLIQDIVPQGVSVNIPPFLQHGKFTETEVKTTKSIGRCRIHVERANARLKDYKILTFLPSHLRPYVDTIFQLCAALVNLQYPLIKECCEGMEFE